MLQINTTVLLVEFDTTEASEISVFLFLFHFSQLACDKIHILTAHSWKLLV